MMDYETAILNVENIEKVKTIVANRINILNLSDIDKYTNLESLKIIECTMSYEDLINYDYSKFVELKELVLIGNSTSKIFIKIDDLAIILHEKIFLDNYELAHETANFFANCNFIYTAGKYICYGWEKIEHLMMDLKNMFDKSNLLNLISYDNFLNKFSDINKIIFDYEKSIYEKNYEIESKIPLNQNIFKLSLDSLIISYYYLNDFLNFLPVDSSLINTLLNLNFRYNYESKCTTFDFYRYIYDKIKKHKVMPKITNKNIFFDNEPICKLTLFRHLYFENRYVIFKYLALDIYELFKIDKNRAFVNLDGSFYNLILYLDKKCYCYMLSDEIINFKSNIKIMHMEIIKYQHLGTMLNTNKELSCIANLPQELEYLYINFINEYHDNYTSNADPSDYLIDNNLPVTLKKLQVCGISEVMKNNIIKIPHSCELLCNIFGN